MYNSLILLFAVIAVVSGHKDGAPISACLTMSPGHENTAPQAANSALHQIQFKQDPANPSRYQVTLGGKSPGGAVSQFKGFFLQARSTTAGDVNPVGTWDVSAANGVAKRVACGGIAGSAVTHTSNAPKQAPLTLTWTPPPVGPSGNKIIFLATIVQDFSTYWVGIHSAELTLFPGSGGSTQQPVGNGTLSSNGIAFSSGNTGNAAGMTGKVSDSSLLAANSNASSSHPLGSARQSQVKPATSASTALKTVPTAYIVLLSLTTAFLSLA